MTLVNTPVSSVHAADDRPTSYEEFLDVLAGLRLSSSRIDIDIDRGQVTLDGSDAGLSAKDLISTVRGQGYRFNSTPAVRVRVTRPVALAA